MSGFIRCGDRIIQTKNVLYIIKHHLQKDVYRIRFSDHIDIEIDGDSYRTILSHMTTVPILQNRIKELESRIKDLEAQLAFSPGGPGYQETQKHYSTLLNNNLP